MTALKRAFSLVLSSILFLFALSCSSGRPPLPPVPLVISPAQLPTAVINVPYSVTLTAVGGVPPYTWGMASGTLPPGLNISAAGVISGTPTALGTTTFKIQVTDVQTPKQAVDTATKSITVNQTLAVSTTSLTAGSIGVPYSGSVAATGGVPPYTWAITSGVLPAGLTLSSSGFITGTPTTQESQTFTVQASDSQSPASTAAATLTLTISGPTGRLSGNYVFSFLGYAKGSMVLRAGSFTADGQGNITNGLMDIGGGPTNVPFTGNYSIGATDTGPMTFIVSSLSQVLANTVAVPASGTIRFIQNGGVGAQGTGVIRKVTSTSPITLAQLAAFWAYGATGADVSANRYGTVGTFQADNTGAWSNLERDVNDNGSVAHDIAASGKFVAIDPVTQRGTATMTVNNVTTNYAFYPASPSELLMVSIDTVSSSDPLALFTLTTRTSNNNSNSSISVPTVAGLQGVGAANGNSAPYALLAFASFDGKGGVIVSTDENLGGTLSANKYTATYSVAANGRTTITGFGSNPVVFYLGGSVAYTLVSDAAVTSGTIVPQSGSPYTNSSINGSYQGATLQAVLPSLTVEADSAAADGAGNLALTYDISGPGGPLTGLTQSQTYSVDSAGRAPLVVNGNTVGIAYVVTGTSTNSPTNGRVWVMSTDTNSKINSIEK